ncbi:IS200/IS605 family accessory protein TnpB-related protein [Neobacillus sp. Marseille-QA0830]
MLQTYQTKLPNIPLDNVLSSEQYLQEYAAYFGKLERKLFVQSHIKGASSSSLKKTFMKQYGITARQFNSLRMQLDGKVSSFIEKRKLEIQELKSRVAYLQKIINKKTTQKVQLHQNLQVLSQTHPSFQRIVKRYQNLKHYLHQKKRRLRNLRQKLEKLESDAQNHTLRICFGSKKLLHKQFHLEENQYKNHQEWRNDWLEARSSQFLVIGSKGETYGNQTATYDRNNTLRLRVANYFTDTFGRYIEFPAVLFPYGQVWLDKAKVPSMGFTRSGRPQKYYSSITYRFMKQEKGWYVHATVERETPKAGTSNGNGFIGVDLNAGFIAVCEIDRFGNPIHSWTIKVPMYSRRKEQVVASMSDAIKSVLEYAVSVRKNVMIEKLDFSKKRTRLREMGPAYARMLSGFAYSTFQQLIESKAKKAGVNIKRVNPAYTSQIGQMKFMARYGLSSNQAAACMIARRGYHFRTEKPKYDTILSFSKRFDKHQSNYRKWRAIANHLKKEYDFQDKIELLKADI